MAIGGIIKETKPSKILVEDDEGKVSISSFGSLPPTLEPAPSAAPQNQGFPSPRGITVAGQTPVESCPSKQHTSVLGHVSRVAEAVGEVRGDGPNHVYTCK